MALAVQSGPITAFELSDPNMVAAGWATMSGLGTDVDTA